MSKILQYLDKYLLHAFVFLLPLVVLPIFPSAFSTTKLSLGIFLGLAIVLVKAVKVMSSRKLSFSTSKYDFPVFILAIAYFVSSIIKTPNRLEAFFLPGTAGAVIIGCLLYFVVNQEDSKGKDSLKYTLIISVLISSVVKIMSQIGIFKSISQLPSYISDPAFTTLGGSMQALMYTLPVLVLAGYLAVKQINTIKKVGLSVAALLILFALIITGFELLPGDSAQRALPDLTTSWNVAVDTLKESPFFGIGPGNYLTAFSRFRPISYNQTKLWQIRFASASNTYLTILTEAGILGFGSLLVIVISYFKSIQEDQKTSKLPSDGIIALGLILILFAIFPAAEAVLILIFLLLALSTKTQSINLTAQYLPVFVTALPLVTLLLISLPVMYWQVNALRSEISFKKSLDAIGKNDGKLAYDYLRETIGINPYSDRYRITYAQINLALANSLAQKKDLGDEDKNTIGQLIQQAIREGKAAVTLNPQRAGNWEVLAGIYKAVIPLAKGADGYALQTYNQAIALDPMNPNTRIALGGVYYTAKNYDAAIEVLKLAVLTKPDMANSHYNLALAYREKGDEDKAITELETVLSLVQKDSQDYKLASTDLENLKNNKKPKIEETNKAVPQITLPEEATPPASTSPLP